MNTYSYLLLRNFNSKSLTLQYINGILGKDGTGGIVKSTIWWESFKGQIIAVDNTWCARVHERMLSQPSKRVQIIIISS